LAVYDQTLQWVPTNAYYHNNRARILLAQSRLHGQPPREAEEALRSAVRYSPENPFFLSQWGITLLLLGHSFESESALDRAFSLNGDLAAETLAQIAFDYHRSGNRPAAHMVFTEALRRRPLSAKTRFLKGWAAWQEGRKKEGRSDFDEAVRLQPELADVREAILNEKQ
jgi:tetratricopeptide (TPR) repeat protein